MPRGGENDAFNLKYLSFTSLGVFFFNYYLLFEKLCMV